MEERKTVFSNEDWLGWGPVDLGAAYALYPPWVEGPEEAHHGELTEMLEFAARRALHGSGQVVAVPFIHIVAACAATIITGYYPRWLARELGEDDAEYLASLL